MTVKYALYPNPLTSETGEYRAIVQEQQLRTMDDIIDEMVREGSTVTRGEALAVIEEYHAAIRRFLAKGDRIATPMWQIKTSVKGAFADKSDRFDPKRHKIRVNVSPGPELKEVNTDINVKKVSKRLPQPILVSVYDIVSDSQNETLSPGGMARLYGSRLKFDEDDREQGIFIRGPGGEVRVSKYIHNKPSRLIFMVPEVNKKGTYRMAVRNRPNGNETEIREGELGKALTI